MSLESLKIGDRVIHTDGGWSLAHSTTYGNTRGTIVRINDHFHASFKTYDIKIDNYGVVTGFQRKSLSKLNALDLLSESL